MDKTTYYLPIFSGTYESNYGTAIDSAIKLAFDEDARLETGLSEIAWHNMASDYHTKTNYRGVFKEVHERYFDEFCHVIEREDWIVFTGSAFPRYYNYSHDEIHWAFKGDDDAGRKELFDFCYEDDRRGGWASLVKEKCSSRPGFSSFISNDIFDEQWQRPVSEFREGQVTLMLHFYAMEITGEETERDLDDVIEREVIDQMNGSNEFEEKLSPTPYAFIESETLKYKIEGFSTDNLMSTFQHDELAVELWDIGGGAGLRYHLAYRVYLNGKVVYVGKDFSPSPMHEADSPEAMACFLSFLTMGQGGGSELYDSYPDEIKNMSEEIRCEVDMMVYDLENPEQADDPIRAVSEFTDRFTSHSDGNAVPLFPKQLTS